ncbi:MAG TPA: hypothetical protein VN901_16930 [Candidatus Acidoferrales bacterium]|nr:hypothetical protein [Candidatus Acidoferrales bacterium]
MRNKYPEVRDKVVDSVQEWHTDDGFHIAVTFKDQTVMTWDISAKIVLKPDLRNFKSGNGKLVRSYPTVRTRD